MIQVIEVPAKSVENFIPELALVIKDKTKPTARVVVGARTPLSTEQYAFNPIQVDLTMLIQEEISKGNLTNADIVSLKKCVRAICAKALKINYSQLVDPL